MATTGKTAKKSWGGSRRGSGRRNKSGTDFVTVSIYSGTYRHWNALKDRLHLPSNESVAEYLLNLSDSFDLRPEGSILPIESTPKSRPCISRLSESCQSRQLNYEKSKSVSDDKEASVATSQTLGVIEDSSCESDFYDSDIESICNRTLVFLNQLGSEDENSDCSSVDVDDAAQSDQECEEHGISSEEPQHDSSSQIIVSLHKLLQLFPKVCSHQHCNAVTDVTTTVCGCCISITKTCTVGHKFTWHSSEQHSNSSGTIFSNNLILAASILFSGNSFSKISHMFDICHLSCISQAMFYWYQNLYLIPVVKKAWHEQQQELFRAHSGEEIVVCGDGRCDSPGSSAKLCSYTLMDAKTKAIIHTETITREQVQYKSPNMERLGLHKALSVVCKELTVSEVVTNASVSIIAMIARDFPNIVHSLDIWHKAKKLRKALAEASKNKGMEKLSLWSDKIVNHFWYCCEKAQGNTDTLKTKWVAVLHHVIDEHEWATGECDHSELPEDTSLQYFNNEEPAFLVLQEIVTNHRWLTSLKYYVHFRHTGMLESFHNIMLGYVPKRINFSDKSYHTRVLLAVLDYNSNLGRHPLEDTEGDWRYRRLYRKRTKHWDVVPVLEKKTHPYMLKLMK